MIGELLMDMYSEAAKLMLEDKPRCLACEETAVAHVLVTRNTGEMKEAIVCKAHLLDPGPLLDW